MICDKVALPGLGTAIVCSRGPRRQRKLCAECKLREHTKLCDGKRQGTNCDKPLCDSCATTVPNPKKSGETLDFCSLHKAQAPAEQLALGARQ